MMEKRLSLALVTAILFIAAIFAGCGKGKENVRNENVATPGRDKELYQQASDKLKKGRYDESRLLFNVIVSTYPDSEYLSLSKLAIADSYYLEGGSSNLEQAVAQYRDFVQYFPTHPKVCDVYLKMAESFMRQMGAYNRDMTKANQAYRQLKAAQSKCGNSELKNQVATNLTQVEGVLALHELDVADTYVKRRAWKSVELRSREVIEKYSSSQFLDTAYFYAGIAMIEQEQPEEAVKYFTNIVRDIPKSEFAGKSKEYLERLGKPIPEPANDNPAPLRPTRYEKVKLMFGLNELNIRQDAVMLKKKGGVDEKTVQQTTEVSNSNEIKSVRSGGSTAAAPAATTPAASTPKTETAPDAKSEAKTEPKTDSAKSTDSKDSKDSKDKKKKKGPLGIFK